MTMGRLQGKKILLGISGSIAAYKSAFLTRLLIKSGAEVQVIMTEASCQFISPLTLSTLSKNKVHLELLDGDTWDNHVELGLWADCFLIAPITAHSLGKLAHGLSNDMLSATYLSARCPVMIAPAMDLDMWSHPATKRNIEVLESDGVEIIPVGDGELASGLKGPGRMAEPEHILAVLEDKLTPSQSLEGKRALVTAGPTFEALDPVRFIGNHSSGKMGIAIAHTLEEHGAEVHLVLGPSQIRPKSSIQVYPVTSAQQMYEACVSLHGNMDICVFAAAVADYRPASVAIEKMKKSDDDLTLELERTIDIAATLGKQKKPGQIHVGFALETDQGIQHAQEKVIRKHFDFIVLNSLKTPGAGFKVDTNQVTIIDKNNKQTEFELKSKKEVAKDIVHEIIQIL